MKKSIKTFLKHPTKDSSNRSANPAVIRASTILFNSMQELYFVGTTFNFLIPKPSVLSIARRRKWCINKTNKKKCLYMCVCVCV